MAERIATIAATGKVYGNSYEKRKQSMGEMGVVGVLMCPCVRMCLCIILHKVNQIRYVLIKENIFKITKRQSLGDWVDQVNRAINVSHVTRILFDGLD